MSDMAAGAKFLVNYAWSDFAQRELVICEYRRASCAGNIAA